MNILILSKKKVLSRFVVVFLIYVLGCGKNDNLDNGQRCKVESKSDQDDNIIGEWKLVKGQTVFKESKTIDYSCNNIVYKFQEDGTLVVSSDVDAIIDLEIGQYTYHLDHEPLESSDEEFTLLIGELVMGCEISTDTLILNHSYLDGPILRFVRVK